MEGSWRQRLHKIDRKTRADVAVAVGTVATALLGGHVYAHQQTTEAPQRPAYLEPYNIEDDVFLPIIKQDHTSTPTITPSPTSTPVPPPTEPSTQGGCSGMTAYTIDNRKNGVVGPFPPLANGAIFTLESPNSGKVKYLHKQHDNPLVLYDIEDTPYDLDGNWYFPPPSCTFAQVEQEYDNNNDYIGKTWQELCDLKVTCEPPAPTPTSTVTPTATPTQTPVPEVCPPDQVQSQKLPRPENPDSYHIVDPPDSGASVLFGTDRPDDPPGGYMGKTFIDPLQEPWYFYDASVEIQYSETCTKDQMYKRFKEEPFTEYSWNQLCHEQGITCQPTPTP